MMTATKYSSEMCQGMTKLVDGHKKCRENNNNWQANPYEQFSQSNQVKVTVFHATIMDSRMMKH
jgi:hypothetical protein